MIKVVVFDWDDVFTTGSTDGYIDCYHQALVDVGVHLDPEVEEQRLKSKWGTNHIEEFKALLVENPELVEKAGALYEKYLFGETYTNHLKLVDGAIELLERLKENYTLTLATGVHPKLLKEVVMPKFSIPDYFAQLASGYDFEDPSLCKPNPYSLNIIMNKQNVQANELVMIGDAENDMRMAQSAGTHSIAVLTGHLDRQNAESLGVKNIVDDVTKIEAVLNKINQ